MHNELHSNRRYKGFSMINQGPQINHLAFVDDTIIFFSSVNTFLQLTLNTLTVYEKVSGKLINKSKCYFTMAPGTTQSTITMVRRILGMRYDKLPMKYLGYPLYSGRMKLSFFSEMVCKVINRIRGWYLKFLSSGGQSSSYKTCSSSP